MSTRRRCGSGTGSTRWSSCLFVTGYLIASPLPTLGGEASAHFQMGYIRFAHFAAGADLGGRASLLRIYWAFVGNAACAPDVLHPVLARRFWYEAALRAALVSVPRQVSEEICRPQSARHIWRCSSLFTLLSTVHDLHRLRALFRRARAHDSWQAKLFGWVFSIWPNSQEVHTLHHLGMWVMVMLHRCCTSTRRSARTSCRARR